MNRQITFITGNASKARQLSQYLGLSILHKKINLIEIQSLDLSEVIKHKAIEAYRQIMSPVIVDDVSLVINSLGELPGPFIKYFLSELGSKKICQIVSGLEGNSAIAQVSIGYHDGTEASIFTGIIEGSIAKSPIGSNGFGWDEIFIPKGYTKTRGEMNDEDYDITSPRRMALEKLNKFLKKNI